MKRNHFPFLLSWFSSGLDLTNLAANHRHRLYLGLFLALCLNLAISPVVWATTNGTIARSTAYAIGLLGLVVIGLASYLVFVIFQPERF